MSANDEKKAQKKKQEQPQKKTDIKDWLKSLYKTDLMTEDELKTLYESIRYQGFNREDLLIGLHDRVGDPKIVIQLVILCALQGPKGAAKTKLPSTGKSPTEMGIPASVGKATIGVSCGRISAATADLAAFYMKKLQVPKRIEDSSLPGWLQFPSAGAIKLPNNLREAHVDFSKTFSPIIGGTNTEQIDTQMIQNT
jgi:hypothetical protein